MDLTEIKETFEFLEDWEDRYRFIIDLGRDVEPLNDTEKIDDHLVRGCQSQVWLIAEEQSDGTLSIRMDSDAHIVRGLIALVLSALDGRTPEAILEHDTQGLFEELDLIQHLSPTRGNGLAAMLARIKSIAQDTLDQ